MEWVLRTCSKSLEKEQQHILHKYDYMENSNKASVKQIKILSKTFIQCIEYPRQYHVNCYFRIVREIIKN